MKPVLSRDSYGYVSAWPQDSSAATVSPFFSVFPTALIVQALWKQRQEKGQNGICKWRNKLQKCRRDWTLGNMTLQHTGSTQFRTGFEQPSPGERGSLHLDGNFLSWQMGIECLLANISPLITNYTRERSFIAGALEIWNLISRDLQERWKIDVWRQTAGVEAPQARGPAAAHSGFESGRRVQEGGDQKRSGRREIRRTTLTIPLPSLLFLSSQIRAH